MNIRPTVAGSLLTLLFLVPCSLVYAQGTLVEFASLPADTFTPGPTSGQFIAPANGRVPPFDQRQPVQGISSVLRSSNGDFLVMSDNGFGAKENSTDYVLRVYRRARERLACSTTTTTRSARVASQVRPIRMSSS